MVRRSFTPSGFRTLIRAAISLYVLLGNGSEYDQAEEEAIR